MTQQEQNEYRERNVTLPDDPPARAGQGRAVGGGDAGPAQIQA